MPDVHNKCAVCGRELILHAADAQWAVELMSRARICCNECGERQRKPSKIVPHGELAYKGQIRREPYRDD